jgi:hypothetical protein
MSGSHTFNIHDGAGVRLASITLYNYGYNTAHQEAQAVAKLLTDGNWSISRAEPETKATQFIDEHVEVRS